MALELEREERAGAPQAWESHEDPALRAEHDAVAQQLAVRPSVDALRRAAIQGFVGLVSFGVAWGLLWDRYGKTPTEHALAHTGLYRAGFLITGIAAFTLFALCAATLVRWRRLAREEDELFARLCTLRRAVGIDP